ncbi:hypothetical protein PCANC_02642 [Puccinia coronata f. sp. avenae]|uniref:Uncharacterized protein n=1 Tax=Puccinia coronata f. sp. avenae TaxID=200324 RepID=A0A2N5W5K2_9BASI|nr:hypothetical protein PCANC_02642 [Puccinia coronata f. sp. avenae]
MHLLVFEILIVSNDKLSTTGSERDVPPPWGPHTALISPNDANDAEVPQAKANLSVHRSPACKAARSLAGEGVHDEFSCLSFARKQPTLPSPTCKWPNSQLSSSIASVPPPQGALDARSRMNPSVAPSSHVDSSLASDELPRPPLTKEGRNLTLEGFLQQCYFRPDDVIAHGLLALNCIGHWDYFRLSSIKQLMAMPYPFPRAIAQQMMDWARALEYTYVQHGYSYSYEV